MMKCNQLYNVEEMKKIYFSKEQIERAKSIDLARFLESRGEELQRSGSEWRWKRYDSVTIRGAEWFRHSRGIGGNAVDFVMNFYNKSFADAIEMLLKREAPAMILPVNTNKKTEKKEFKLPLRSLSTERIYTYLTRKRCINKAVIDYFVSQGLIYEEKKYHNVVFIGKDENGIPRHAYQRGIFDSGEPFHNMIEGSNAAYSFHYNGPNNRLYVFEAPIDLLAFLTLYPRNWQDSSYVALNGVSHYAILKMLELDSNLQEIVLCLDHDDAGIRARLRLKKRLTDEGYDKIYSLLPKNKDWNEDLKQLHGGKPKPASEMKTRDKQNNNPKINPKINKRMSL